jgi:predicted deacylase
MRKALSGIVILVWSLIILVIAGMSVYVTQGQFKALPEAAHSATTSITVKISATEKPSSLPPTAKPTYSQPTASPIPTSITSTPAIPQPEIIGYSIAGRPLEVYRFGTGPIQKMIVAGIHGGYEWNTIVLADEMIQYLESHNEVVPSNHTLYILKAFNPDGFERSKGFGGRANENNVDLNRNFPSNWKIEWARPGCWDYIPITGGATAASEPETQALMAFVEAHDLQAFISYHSAALGIFPGGQPPDTGSLSLAESMAEVSDYPYPPIDAGCMFTGQLVDWVSDQGIPAVDIELTNHQDSDFEINLAILSVFLDWSPSN